MKRSVKFIRSLFMLNLVLLIHVSFSQVKVQVVSQALTKQIEWQAGMSVILSGENAEIHCSSYSGNTIDINLTIISKHADRCIAETDLKKMKWLIEVKENICYIRNYIELLRSETRPESGITVIYQIKVPENCPLDIRNYFGKIDIDSIHANLTIKSEFSPVVLTNIQGNTTINSVFGDVTASGIRGKTTITSSRSVVTLKLSSTDQYAVLFDLSDTELIKPAEMHLTDYKDEKGKITATYNQKGNPNLLLNLSHCSLTIEQSNH